MKTYIYKKISLEKCFLFMLKIIFQKKNFKIRQKILCTKSRGGGSECVICDEAEYFPKKIFKIRQKIYVKNRGGGGF